MANPILVTGAAGRVGAVGRTVTELLLKQGKAVRAMVRNEDERAQALRRSWSAICSISIRCIG
jgi:nucleoside-diphosphate-sugar epimerase